MQVSPLWVVLLLALLGAPAAAQERASSEPKSPRLRALERRVKAGELVALDEFWEEVGKAGSPLVEPFDAAPPPTPLPLAQPAATGGPEQRRLVTFLWRSEDEAHVVVLGPSLAWRVEEVTFHRLADTDVWFQSFVVPADTRCLYELSVGDPAFPFDARGSFPGSTRHDPLNPRTWDFTRPRLLSVLELPEAKPLTWVEALEKDRTGEVVTCAEKLESKLLGNSRKVLIYRPAGAPATAEPMPLLVFDASYLGEIRLPVILDHLIADKRIPPVVVAFVVHPQDAQSRESSCDPHYAEFLAREFVPFVRAREHVTSDPHATVIGGASAGGLTSAFVALQHPDVFGNVLSQSGAFWRTLDGDREEEWLARQVVERAAAPVHFFLSVGTLENGDPFMDGSISQLFANRHLRDVLRARGYRVDFLEVSGAHDPFNWELALPDGLIALLGKQSPR